MSRHGRHEWHGRGDDDVLRYVRARRFGRRWTLEARRADEPGWVALEPPPLDDLHELRQVLWNKYRRGRVPHEHVLEIDALIAAAEGEAEAAGRRSRCPEDADP